MIVLDADAAGWGWHIDPAVPLPAGRIDLLTVLRHEIGHLLGLGHATTGVMKDELAPDERVLPAKRAAAPVPVPVPSPLLAALFRRAVTEWWRGVVAKRKAAKSKKASASKRCGKRPHRAKRGKCRPAKGKRARARRAPAPPRGSRGA